MHHRFQPQALAARGIARVCEGLPSSETPGAFFCCFKPRCPTSVPELVEDAMSGPESLDGRPCILGAEKEPLRTLGLTKEVLAAHTQREEQSFLLKFKEMRKLTIFQSRCHYYLQEKSKGQLSERGKWQNHILKMFFLVEQSPGLLSMCGMAPVRYGLELHSDAVCFSRNRCPGNSASKSSDSPRLAPMEGRAATSDVSLTG